MQAIMPVTVITQGIDVYKCSRTSSCCHNSATNIISQSYEGSDIWPNLILSILGNKTTGHQTSDVAAIHLTAQKMHRFRLTIISGFVLTEYNRKYIAICFRKKQLAIRVLNCTQLQTEETYFTSCTDKNRSPVNNKKLSVRSLITTKVYDTLNIFNFTLDQNQHVSLIRMSS